MENDPQIGFGVESIKGRLPVWTPVPQSQLGNDPFRNLCQIRTATTSGSGWLSADGHVYTAAHVVHPYDRCEVRFAASSNWIRSQSVRLHRDYGGSNWEGSPADLARIQLPAGANLPGLQVDTYAAGPVSAKGFSSGTLVQDGGHAMHWEAYICHSADTLGGHSGCPVMVGSKVVGIHVGPMSLVNQFFQTQNNQTHQFINGAVRFGSTQLSALAGQQ
jgi:V8-like Glu-specific endopeptidase